jgi:hypothetical protein
MTRNNSGMVSISLGPPTAAQKFIAHFHWTDISATGFLDLSYPTVNRSPDVIVKVLHPDSPSLHISYKPMAESIRIEFEGKSKSHLPSGEYTAIVIS